MQIAQSSGAGSATTSIPLASAGAVAAGDLRTYQLWYRDPVGSPRGNEYNLSHGAELVRQP